jgi:hypothetical protein
LVNWDNIYNNIKKKEEYKIWLGLRENFSNLFTIREAIMYCLKDRPVDNFDEKRAIINKALKEDGIKLPPIYAGFVRKKLPPLSKMLIMMRDVSDTYTMYAAMSSIIFFEPRTLWVRRSQIYLAKISDYNPDTETFLDHEIAEWLKPILRRQYELCKNINLSADDPFFFLMVYGNNRTTLALRDIAVTNIAHFMSQFKFNYGFDFNEYVKEYTRFSGLKRNSLLTFYSHNEKYAAMDIDRTKYAYIASPVKFKMDNKIRCGFCLGQIENGVFLVQWKQGYYVVPIYSFCNVRSMNDLDKRELAETGRMEYSTLQSMKLGQISNFKLSDRRAFQYNA